MTKKKLKEGLIQAVRLIREWHDLEAKLNDEPQDKIDIIWDIYYRKSPEMKIIREALEG